MSGDQLRCWLGRLAGERIQQLHLAFPSDGVVAAFEQQPYERALALCDGV